MKRIFVGLIVLFLIAYSAAAGALPGKDEYRYGLRAGILYPWSGSGIVKSDTMMAMIELDTKHNSRFESGFRFGYDAFIAQASNCYGAYDNFVAGYGLRYYFDDRVSPEINFHSFKRYVLADGILSLANKNKDLDNTIVSPRNLLGIGLKVGAGLEYVFGPLSSGFVDLEYLIMNTRVSGDSFPASGLIASFGVRIEK